MYLHVILQLGQYKTPVRTALYFQIKASSKGLVMSIESVFENMGPNWFFYFGRILQEPEVHENQLK